MESKEKIVCILDYGSGNVKSVFNLLETFNVKTIISNKAVDFEKASHFILPGVGSFGAAMEKINANIPLEELKKDVFVNKKPFLGICVGMQVLADFGNEFGRHKGLGWISGEVKKLETDLPLPHMGWNNTNIIQNSPLVAGINEKADFYFVHSYAFFPTDQKEVTARTTYGENFASIIQKDNIFGVQFHPEKSQSAGRILISNFLN